MDDAEHRIALLQNAAANRRLRAAGIVVGASAPILLLAIGALGAYLDAAMPVIVALLYALIAAPAGAGIAVFGHVRRRASLRMLEAADAKRLAPARLLR
jgi:multisubunit Na+/H+ antiporter MnhG subunit